MAANGVDVAGRWIVTKIGVMVQAVIDHDRRWLEYYLKTRIVEHETDLEKFYYELTGLETGFLVFEVRAKRAVNLDATSIETIRATLCAEE